MNRWALRKINQFALGYFASVGGIACGTLYYIRQVDNITQDASMYPYFEQLRLENPSQLYQRKVSSELCMEDIVKALFAQPFYQLEILVSGTNFKPEEFQYKVGSNIGNMKLEAVYQDECVFRYLYEGFNYRLYLKKDNGSLEMGYVEYTGSYLQDIGCRLYVPLLLEGLSRRLQ